MPTPEAVKALAAKHGRECAGLYYHIDLPPADEVVAAKMLDDTPDMMHVEMRAGPQTPWGMMAVELAKKFSWNVRGPYWHLRG